MEGLDSQQDGMEEDGLSDNLVPRALLVNQNSDLCWETNGQPMQNAVG